MLTQVFWLYTSILFVGIKVYSFEKSSSKSKVLFKLVSEKVSEMCTCANAICI